MYASLLRTTTSTHGAFRHSIAMEGKKVTCNTAARPAAALRAAEKPNNTSGGARRVDRGASTVARAQAADTAKVDAKVGEANDSGYRMPPDEIRAIVDKPSQPALSITPDRTRVLQMHRPPPNPSIKELARPELKLAGLTIDAGSFSRSRMGYYTGLSVVPMGEILPSENGLDIHGYPEGMWINYASYNKAGTHVAFTIRSPGGPDDPPREPLELWVADISTGKAHRVLESPAMGLNSIFQEYCWADDDTILASVVPRGCGPPPDKPTAPTGPKVQDNSSGKKSQNRTYQDLLQDEGDAALFEYYCSSEMIEVNVLTGETRDIAPKRMYTGYDPSPDGKFLLVSWMERPFSYTVPCGRFPKVIEVWDRDGNFVHEVGRLPLAEDIPIDFNACRQGPRSVGWRDDKPSELSWIECQDGGDPKVEISPRDIVYTLPVEPDMDGAGPRVLGQTDLRCGGVAWCDDDLALLYESWWKTRKSVISTISPGADDPLASKEVLFDRNYEDVYSDPGSPATRRTPWGSYIIAKLDGERKLLMTGRGASPEGNRPFIDVLDLSTKETERIWRSSPPFLESPGSILSDADEGPISLDNLRMLATRENQLDPPQYHIKTITEGGKKIEEALLTNFPHPYPTLRELNKQILRYKRKDDVDLTATLYLPPGYDKERDGPLPCLLWAYPREFKSKAAAGQMRKSPHSFTGIGSTSAELWLARGYAILDGPTMPIIAEGEGEEPNDTYVEQLTMSAEAAVEEVTRLGVVDPERIAVGGHSYGAFMAANLLAHAPNLFSCAIARSGAYNRTLTPFGFQAEERTIWQAPDTYITMSPFMMADKITKPVLLIHGEDDKNIGTWPIQSERFYGALQGHGVPCRLVILPHERHGYSAHESIMHTLYEMDTWLEAHNGGAGSEK